MQKTYLELAAEVIAAMISRGYIKVVPEKGEDWKKQNVRSIHTIGWAIEEMYREICSVPSKARLPRKKEQKPPSRIIVRG